VQAALGGDQPGLDARVPRVEVGEQVGDGVTGALHRLGVAGVAAQDGRNANLDSHDLQSPSEIG
jgi:hypothetical protein